MFLGDLFGLLSCGLFERSGNESFGCGCGDLFHLGQIRYPTQDLARRKHGGEQFFLTLWPIR